MKIRLDITKCGECPCRCYSGVCEDGSLEEGHEWFCSAWDSEVHNYDDMVIEDLESILDNCPLKKIGLIL